VTGNKTSSEKRIERSRGEDVGQTVRGNGWLYTADDLGLFWRSSEPRCRVNYSISVSELSGTSPSRNIGTYPATPTGHRTSDVTLKGLVDISLASAYHRDGPDERFRVKTPPCLHSKMMTADHILTRSTTFRIRLSESSLTKKTGNHLHISRACAIQDIAHHSRFSDPISMTLTAGSGFSKLQDRPRQTETGSFYVENENHNKT
jgi:hypothetical protein